MEEETQQTEEDTSPAESIEDELCFQLPFRQGGFFRTWLPSYFVLTTYSICMYPNEKRNEKKKKEILLCDAMVAVLFDQFILILRILQSIQIQDINSVLVFNQDSNLNNKNLLLLLLIQKKKKKNLLILLIDI